ncbi:MAG: hypothetical protein ACKOJH_12785 [Actinomycetota bacterium]
MSDWIYLTQTLLIAGVLLFLLRKESIFLSAQVIFWAAGVSALMWRFGTSGMFSSDNQLSFYSNDQVFYVATLQRFVNGDVPLELSWWLDIAKVPYTISGLPLVLLGIHQDLALKTVSLLCLLALSRALLKRSTETHFWGQLKVIYLTGCGLIGSFFSILALRETMMMLLVYRFATSQSAVNRVGCAFLLFLLRPHLAVAIVMAEAIIIIWEWFTRSTSARYLQVSAILAIGSTIGITLFSWRVEQLHGSRSSPFADWGIAETTRIASNFVGLQFLTNDESKLRMTVTELLLLRFVLSETILIPLGFSVACLLFAHNLKTHHLLALSAFATYVSVATNTDFNSFRQNIPFMPLLGFVILDMIRLRREETRTIQSQRPVGGRSIRGGSTGSEGEIKPIRTR